MVRVQVKYENGVEKLKILAAFKRMNIKKISKAYKEGKYYRIYIDIE